MFEDHQERNLIPRMCNIDYEARGGKIEVWGCSTARSVGHIQANPNSLHACITAPVMEAKITEYFRKTMIQNTLLNQWKIISNELNTKFFNIGLNSLMISIPSKT